MKVSFPLPPTFVSETCYSNIFLLISKVKKSVLDKTNSAWEILTSLYPLQAWEFSLTRLARLWLLSQFFLVIPAIPRFKGSRLVRHKSSSFIFIVGTAALCFKEICLNKQRNWKGRKIKTVKIDFKGFTFSRRRQQLGSVLFQHSKNSYLSPECLCQNEVIQQKNTSKPQEI